MRKSTHKEGLIVNVRRPAWTLPMDFPERLARLRKERSLTLQGLADLTGVHITQIQRYEAGQTQPTLDVVRKLAIALSVSADTLIFDTDERGPDDMLKLQFEAVRQFDEEDKHLAHGLLEGLILKHQAKQSLLRTTTARSAPTDKTRKTAQRASG
jgi:transcriptional regulator with XRE-family HTH domain